MNPMDLNISIDNESLQMAAAIIDFREALGEDKANELDMKLKKGGEEGLTDLVSNFARRKLLGMMDRLL